MQRLKNIARLGDLTEEFVNDRQQSFILIVDLCASTEFKQFILENGLSDRAWLVRQLRFLQLLEKHIAAAKGTVVKSLGDGVLAIFDYSETADDILNAAANLIKELSALSSYTGREKIEVKISIDFGDTINGTISSIKYDPLGLCVDRCSRLNSEAGRNEIVYSESFGSKLGYADLTLIHSDLSTAIERTQELKGIGDTTYYIVGIQGLSTPKTSLPSPAEGQLAPTNSRRSVKTTDKKPQKKKATPATKRHKPTLNPVLQSKRARK